MRLELRYNKAGRRTLRFGNVFEWDDFPDGDLGLFLHGKSASNKALSGLGVQLRSAKTPEMMDILVAFISDTWPRQFGQYCFKKHGLRNASQKLAIPKLQSA